MDWKYIFSMATTTEDLEESKKDELLNTIAWYDFSLEELDSKKYSALLHLCQEIMKHKSEQVDALLAELDEMAMNQAAEEAQTRESDDRSSRSKKSYDDDDEQNVKYRDLKLKYRKLQKNLDVTKEDNDQLKKNVKMLEQERVYLQRELRQAGQKDDCASDISETIKDQQKHLMENVQQKNSQISQLLTDIENVESDNLQLRLHLSTLREDVSEATEKIETLLNQNKTIQTQLKQSEDSLQKAQLITDGYKQQIDDLLSEKEAKEAEFDEFAKEIDQRIDEWKKVLEAKNQEISHLKSNSNTLQSVPQRTSTGGSDSFPPIDETQVKVLQKALDERETTIIRLQKQLEKATKEMLKCTQVIKLVTKERDNFAKKCEKMNSMSRELRKQLNRAHKRSQELSANIEYYTKVVKEKESEMKEVYKQIKDPDLQTLLQNLDQIKSEKRIKEKKLSEVVVNYNKLQSISDALEKENVSLRERLGLTEDDFISTKPASFREKQSKKQFLQLQQKLNTCEEEKLQYRLEVQKLSKLISNLSDQLLDLGETPIFEGQEINVAQLRETTPKLNPEDEKSRVIEYQTLLEENDALRKGLHEILESIQNKQVTSSTEITSTTLEYLLRALDAKHVSGWYHPAMRLQAEVHTLQGSNNVLRHQLRSAREELDTCKEKSSQLIKAPDSEFSNAAAIANLNNHLINVLKNYKTDESTNVKLVDKLETYKKEFLLIQEQICVLYNQYTDEKTKWEADLIMSEKKVKEINAAYDSLREQWIAVKELESSEDTEGDKIKIVVETTEKLVVINRKLVYLENLDGRYKAEIDKLKKELLEQCQEFTRKENKLKTMHSELLFKVDHLERNNLDAIIPENLIKLQNDYDQLLIKQRQLLQTLDDVSEINSNEIQLLKKSISFLEAEKAELVNKCLSLKNPNPNEDDNSLRRQLAQSEITEITERQRADHTNSLYELVKEQLAKSEERHQEYQKFNGDLIQKNLLLQETVKILEDKVMHYVDGSKIKEVQIERDCLNTANQKLAKELINMREELNLLKKEMASKLLCTHLDQSELHSLRHQIVDLQASGDDKAVIARLSSDVVLARIAEAEVRKKMDEIVCEMDCARNEGEMNIEKLRKENRNLVNTIKSLKENTCHLKVIIKQQRSHYLGYIPYISQEKLQNKIASILNDKKLIYNSLERTEQIEFDCKLINETLERKIETLNELNEMMRDGEVQARILEKWFLEKTNVQLQELRCRRQAEFKEAQLRQANARIQEQERQIAQLEAELLQMLYLNGIADLKKEEKQEKLEKLGRLTMSSTNVVEIAPVATRFSTAQTDQLQADSDFVPTGNVRAIGDNEECEKLKKVLKEKKEELRHHKEDLQSLKEKLVELEITTNLLRQQISDKQSQINFYEKHILEMQQSKTEPENAENIHLLKEAISEKEHIIYNLQSLLKKDRDEHSLAAARFQEELKQLQGQLTHQEQSQEKPARVAVEYYIQQVHALEKLTAELQTSVSTLSTQLQSSREECVRWRTLSNDRLQSVEELRIQLEEGHKTELEVYKIECEKWRNEVNTLQLYINSYKKDIVDLRPNIEKELKDKDNKIHELLINLRQLKSELRKRPQPLIEKPEEENFENIKETLLREQEILKKRCEQLLGREKIAREEIRTLKGQLMKRPALSARTDSCPIKEQQARKILSLEKQITELREKLEREAALNEAHKTKVSADFDKWNKLKHWQQTSERIKNKLREKSEECDKVQQTCSNYRVLIERLEREKHNLEVRLRNAKSDGRKHGHAGGGDEANGFIMYATLGAENQKLIAEVDSLKGKLEQQQHHSGALSSAMLQDKLKAQERKIAILEMSAKGGGEMRAEMERVQNANATLHKANLRLEAENLEMHLDLEKSSNELPHLREQIKYLENYINLVKSHSSASTADPIPPQDHTIPESKRVSELERTVLALKRVVEKLQVENKRLTNGRSRHGGTTERTGSGDRFKQEYNRLKQQYDEKVTRVETLEKELSAKEKVRQEKPSDAGDAEKKLQVVQEELQYKAELLEKVKILLQRAAVKEKALVEQVTTLKRIIDSK